MKATSQNCWCQHLRHIKAQIVADQEGALWLTPFSGQSLPEPLNFGRGVGTSSCVLLHQSAGHDSCLNLSWSATVWALFCWSIWPLQRSWRSKVSRPQLSSKRHQQQMPRNKAAGPNKRLHSSATPLLRHTHTSPQALPGKSPLNTQISQTCNAFGIHGARNRNGKLLCYSAIPLCWLVSRWLCGQS